MLRSSGARMKPGNFLAVYVRKTILAGQIGNKVDLPGLLQHIRVRSQSRDGPAEVLRRFAFVETEEFLKFFGLDVHQHALGTHEAWHKGHDRDVVRLRFDAHPEQKAVDADM